MGCWVRRLRPRIGRLGGQLANLARSATVGLVGAIRGTERRVLGRAEIDVALRARTQIRQSPRILLQRRCRAAILRLCSQELRLVCPGPRPGLCPSVASQALPRTISGLERADMPERLALSGVETYPGSVCIALSRFERRTKDHPQRDRAERSHADCCERQDDDGEAPEHAPDSRSP